MLPQQAERVDLLVYAQWLLPIVPADTLYHDYAIAVRQGRITGLCPRAEAPHRYQAKHTLELAGQVLLPGLINAHGHAPMSLFKGMANDKPLEQWLQEDIWPAEKKWVNKEFVRDGAQLAIAEMLLSGTTCFSDMYFFPETVAKVACEAGIRSQLAFPILDFPTVWGSGPDQYIEQGTALLEHYQDHPLIRIAFGPHAPYTVSVQVLERIAMLSHERQTMVQMHVHESASEIANAVRDHGTRPLAMLRDIGLLNPRMQCVHACHLNQQDIDDLASTASHVVHCPESNLKLASGICPITQLIDRGINVALGTDSAASNNDLDLFGELRTAALLAKGHSGDATALPAFKALEMATINGARALGREDCLGSLETGKWADMIAVDLTELRLQPVYHPQSHLVYNQVSHRVSHVWVGGEARVANYQLQTLDAVALAQRAQHWSRTIISPASSNHA
jgi:5-methylthioadenosine/S-adenosylhomocysteine deaminase